MEKNKFDSYEFRCSALGKIVSKSGKMTDTIKTYLKDLLICEIHGIKKEAWGKALSKGLFCEQDGITMLRDVFYPGKLILKNKERKRNGFIHGECDVSASYDDCITDIKNALDLFTFGRAELSHEYKIQLKGYNWLWGRKNARLFYCLFNMPEVMVIEEERMLFYKHMWKYRDMEDPLYLEDCQKLRQQYNYDHMHIYEKFKYWEFEFKNEDKDLLEHSVIEARKYLNELWEEYTDQIEQNLKVLTSPSILTAHHDNEVGASIIE